MSCVWDNTWLPDEPSHQHTDADNQARLSLLLTVFSVAAKEETLLWPDWSAPSRICWWGRSCRPPGPPPPAPTPGPAWLGLPHISHVTSRWVRGHRHGVRVTAWHRTQPGNSLHARRCPGAVLPAPASSRLTGHWLLRRGALSAAGSVGNWLQTIRTVFSIHSPTLSCDHYSQILHTWQLNTLPTTYCSSLYFTKNSYK